MDRAPFFIKLLVMGSHRKFTITVRGHSGGRIIQKIEINADVLIDRDKLSFEKSKFRAAEIQKDLETVIEKYFDGCDWVADPAPRFEY